MYPVSLILTFCSRRHERQRTAPRWQRGMFSFIYNFFTVRDSAMQPCMRINDGRGVFGENMNEIKCLLKSYQKRPWIFITPSTGSLLRKFKCA